MFQRGQHRIQIRNYICCLRISTLHAHHRTGLKDYRSIAKLLITVNRWSFNRLDATRIQRAAVSQIIDRILDLYQQSSTTKGGTAKYAIHMIDELKDAWKRGLFENYLGLCTKCFKVEDSTFFPDETINHIIITLSQLSDPPPTSQTWSYISNDLLNRSHQDRTTLPMTRQIRVEGAWAATVHGEIVAVDCSSGLLEHVVQS